MAKVKVVIAFHADNSKIGKTVEVSEEEARTLIAEGRARLASDKGNDALRQGTAPTVKPPLPQVTSAVATPAEPPPANAAEADKK